MQTNSHIGTVTGTVCGTLLTVFVNMQSADMVKTVILGVVGAITSFSVSLGLKWVQRRIQRAKN